MIDLIDLAHWIDFDDWKILETDVDRNIYTTS